MKFPATLALLALSGPLHAADRPTDLGPTITTTDGKTYHRGADGHYYPTGTSPVPTASTTPAPTTTVGDGLDAVNAKRAARGLRPFLRDPNLTVAAQRAAEFRARHLMFGHSANDFQFLPPGTTASAAGCAAYPAHYGFMACCVYDDYTFAGAASVVGADGRTYHHIFVSGGCAGGQCPAPPRR